ncbi:hypothetical protein ACQCN2_21090 [Brevibacillus ginsengisoli]|uniref:hypothetical protein n=1 Tax=Brevibacillus ginsengisoli TaxID=363854 RepID=UPI003CE72140
MSQLITTILSVLLLLVVPLGVTQVHTVLQMKSECLELSFAATKFLSNHGGKNETEVLHDLKQFIAEEVKDKAYHVSSDDITISATRIHNTFPSLWSHEDEFRISLRMPYPILTNIFPNWERPIESRRIGTIQVMDYDL